MKKLLLTGLLLFVSRAHAASLNVSQIQISRTIEATYRCLGGDHFSVTYLNGGNGQYFAVLPYKSKPMLLTSMMSADGVKFQADSITWWIKGRNGTLFDARVDADKPVMTGCAST